MSGRYVSHQSISSSVADKPSLPHFSQHLPHELQSFIGLGYRTPLDSTDIWLLSAPGAACGKMAVIDSSQTTTGFGMTAVNLNDKLATFSDHWSPKIVSQFNGHDVMVVKVKGKFNWHSHPDTDDFFLVLRGQITIRLRDQDVPLREGEMYVVPKGVEHCPRGGRRSRTTAHRTNRNAEYGRRNDGGKKSGDIAAH